MCQQKDIEFFNDKVLVFNNISKNNHKTVINGSFIDYKSYYYQKLEKRIFENSYHLICAGESIYEKVRSINNATIIRNAINLDKFNPSHYSSLKIAVVGPFLPRTINFVGLDLFKYILKKLLYL